MIQIPAKVSFDPAKRDKVLAERGLAFEDAAIAVAAVNFTVIDDRFHDSELRYQTYGILRDRVVMIVWTPREDVMHVISMRYCHDREARKIYIHLGRSR